MVPGDVFRQDALLASYQRVSNLGFFNQPLPFPDTKPANEQGDIDVVFRVSEKRTGNINFGASVGQGTGVAASSARRAEPFGQGKRGPGSSGSSARTSMISTSRSPIPPCGNPHLRHDRRAQHAGPLRHRRPRTPAAARREPAAWLPGVRRQLHALFLSYGVDQQSFTGSSTNIAFSSAFRCNDCVPLDPRRVGDAGHADRPPVPDGRHDGPVRAVAERRPARRVGELQRADIEGHFYAPIGTLGNPATSPVKFVLGFSTRPGSCSATRRSSSSCSPSAAHSSSFRSVATTRPRITPFGYDPNASANGASPNAFGKAFLLDDGRARDARVSDVVSLDVL